MRKPLENVKIFKERRQKLAEKAMGSAIIVSAPEEFVRNGSVHFPFRQDSNLYYLTGFEEPESVLVYRPGAQPETVLFCRKKNPDRETWDGFRYGPDQAQLQFGFDKALPIEEFEEETAKLLKGVDKVYYRSYKNKTMDHKMEVVLQKLRLSQGRSGLGLLPVHDADELIGEMRVIKTASDIENLKKACQIGVEAHSELMKYVKPGLSERDLHGFFIYQIMKRGAAREGYNGIVATGAHATTLHYVFNDQTLQKDDLLLVDAGAEFNYFTCDITRSYPVSGKWTREQEEVYQKVLDVQKHIIGMIKPGVPYASLQTTAVDLLTEAMLELGLLSGRKNDIIETLEYKKYYPHGIGHFLGMDVHDAGLYVNKKGEPRLIEENMVFTVEPGLYIPLQDMTVAEGYRGIGVRIEDNIRVTAFGSENMTEKLVKEVSDLTKIIGTGN